MASSCDTPEQHVSHWDGSTYGEVLDFLKSHGVSITTEDVENIFKNNKWEVEKGLSQDMFHILKKKVMCQNSMNCPGEILSLPPLTADPHVHRNTYDELQHLAQNLAQKHIQTVHKVVKRRWEETLGEGMKKALPEVIPVEY